MSLAMFESVMQQLPGGILILNSSCQILYVNHYICRYSDLTAQQLIGKSFFASFPEVPQAWFNRKIEAVLSQKITEQISWQQRLYLLKFPRQDAGDESRRYMAQNCTLMPLPNPVSGELQLCLWIQDASEQARYHAKLLFTQQQLKVHERQDSLTGLMNRSFWQQQLQLEITRAERYERPLSLLLFNVDRFKPFNDKYGHEHGDQLLQALAKFSAALLRDNDLLARFGGAEFAIALPDTAIIGALEVANRFRVQLANSRLLTALPSIQVTISIGVSQYQSDVDMSELIQRAEQALHQAKCAGRNQVSIFTAKNKAG
ncbi:diguanylate cyclase [Alishewanella longhuensis]|uniref:Diguanylate cyclase n=1 Tax=Alishewanella longhuensis TaxID=1091037 RepID=A0ABQ3KYZ6_9ALTE|nr:diguanylate cyclase [Alishewanella longhuensis]GHG65327.1 diguanylate cyclase [Alishewanella longhuensis]